MKRQAYHFPSPRGERSTQVYSLDDDLGLIPFLEIDRSSVSLPILYKRTLPNKIKLDGRTQERQLLIIEREPEVLEEEPVVNENRKDIPGDAGEFVNEKEEWKSVTDKLAVRGRDVLVRRIRQLPQSVVKAKDVRVRKMSSPPQLVEKEEDKNLKQTVVTDKTFSHGGDTGDLIYALASVKTMGGGRLRLVKTNFVREPFFPAKVELLRHFLESQPYITGVEYGESPIGINLDAARRYYGPRKNLCDLVTSTFKLPQYPRKEPWLFCDDPNSVAPVVIARSPRYHNDRCPWKLIREKYHADAVFVGLPEEHAVWQKQFGEVRYQPTTDWWDLCRVIAGAKLFIGNQSAPMALALGLCVSQIIQEMYLPYPNCYFERPGVYYLRGGETEFPDVDIHVMVKALGPIGYHTKYKE